MWSLQRILVLYVILSILLQFSLENATLGAKLASSVLRKRKAGSKKRSSKRGDRKSGTSKAKLTSTSRVEELDPYGELAQFLARFSLAGENDFHDYSVEEIRRALTVLAKSQSALKSMDGATHQFRNVFKERFVTAMILIDMLISHGAIVNLSCMH